MATVEINTKDGGSSSSVVIWLRGQWGESLARSIWCDLTIFGRLTIWVPCWLLCWAVIVLVLPIIPVVMCISFLSDKISWRLPPIFFTR